MTKHRTPAWRGVVLESGEIWAWPMLLMDHNQAFNVLPMLEKHRARWRQWSPGDRVDFDAGASDEDIERVNAWVEQASV